MQSLFTEQGQWGRILRDLESTREDEELTRSLASLRAQLIPYAPYNIARESCASMLLRTIIPIYINQDSREFPRAHASAFELISEIMREYDLHNYILSGLFEVFGETRECDEMTLRRQVCNARELLYSRAFENYWMNSTACDPRSGELSRAIGTAIKNGSIVCVCEIMRVLLYDGSSDTAARRKGNAHKFANKVREWTRSAELYNRFDSLGKDNPWVCILRKYDDDLIADHQF